MFVVLDKQSKFHIPCCHIYILSACRISLAWLQRFITHRHQIASAERHNTKCLTLCNTQHSLDTFWFLLQACRYLLDAAKSGDVNAVKFLFNYTSDICTTDDQYRNTPLIYAAANGHVEVVRVLLECGANVEKANAYQQTAIHGAAWYGYLEVCRLLLEWGAKLNPRDKWKATPLHDAARWGNLSVVKLLVEKGADIKVKNGNGMTASDLARFWKNKVVADWLDSANRG